jgi:hypothetical protein
MGKVGVTEPQRRLPRNMRCRARLRSRVCAATASTGCCPMNTFRQFCRRLPRQQGGCRSPPQRCQHVRNRARSQHRDHYEFHGAGCLRRAFALRFRAGGMVLFIPRRGGTARDASGSPSLTAQNDSLIPGCFRSLLKYTDGHHTPRVKRQTVCTFTSFTRRSTSSLRHSSVPGIINVADPAATAYRNATSID